MNTSYIGNRLACFQKAAALRFGQGVHMDCASEEIAVVLIQIVHCAGEGEAAGSIHWRKPDGTQYDLLALPQFLIDKSRCPTMRFAVVIAFAWTPRILAQTSTLRTSPEPVLIGHSTLVAVPGLVKNQNGRASLHSDCPPLQRYRR
jgi:hypothetical protein